MAEPARHRNLTGWIAALTALAVLDWALTVHAHLAYHHHAGSPTVMPLGQLLGWISSVGLVVVIILLLVARHRQQQWHYRDIPPGPIPPPEVPRRGPAR